MTTHLKKMHLFRLRCMYCTYESIMVRQNFWVCFLASISSQGGNTRLLRYWFFVEHEMRSLWAHVTAWICLSFAIWWLNIRQRWLLGNNRYHPHLARCNMVSLRTNTQWIGQLWPYSWIYKRGGLVKSYRSCEAVAASGTVYPVRSKIDWIGNRALLFLQLL